MSKTAKTAVNGTQANQDKSLQCAPGSKFTGTLQFSETTSSSIVMPIILPENSASNSPNINNGGTLLHQELSARAGGRAGGQNIIDKDDARAVQFFSPAAGKGALDIFGPFGAREACLSGGGLDPFEETVVYWYAIGAAKMAGQPQRLVE